MFGNQLAVNSVPVYVFSVPVLAFLFAEQNGQRGGVLLGGDDQQAVVLFQDLFRSGDAHRAFPPQTGDDKFGIAQ